MFNLFADILACGERPNDLAHLRRVQRIVRPLLYVALRHGESTAPLPLFH